MYESPLMLLWQQAFELLWIWSLFLLLTVVRNSIRIQPELACFLVGHCLLVFLPWILGELFPNRKS